MPLRVVDPGALWEPLTDALRGGACVAPAGDAATRAALRPDEPVTEPDAALIVTTSGSTGRPKAVVLSRTALLASAHATHDRLGGSGTWHCALPPAYVAGAMTLVRAFAAGTEPVLVASDLSDLAPGPGRHYLSLVPTQLHRALAVPDLVGRLRRFAAILLGGAPLDGALRARAEASGLAVVATYGASETCGGCVYDGMPLDGVDVAVGAEGQLSIGGPVVFSGYRLDPAATADALVGGRFITSDRGQVEGGRVRVLGRLDDVVISGGVNVDLATAQRAADAAFGAPDAGGLVLLGVPDADWGVRIVAVTTGGWTTTAVRDRLGATLGRAALPQQVRRVDSLPRTSSGKIDRQRIADTWR